MLEPGIVVLAYANPSTRREHPLQHRVQVQRNVPTQIMLLQAAASAPDRRAQTARKADISRPVERSSTERDVRCALLSIAGTKLRHVFARSVRSAATAHANPWR
jgi:hypothetical protein